MDTRRRTFLKVLGGAAGAGIASQPLFRAFADPPVASDEFFVLIHASGGWDVTLSLDPRNERRGIIEPGSTDTIDTAPIRLWRDAPLDADSSTFEILRPSGSSLRFGPAIGALAEMPDRLTVINGLAMNTVSHPDGTFFAATGRHLAGGKPVAASIDTMLANEFGRESLLPTVSVGYPSTYVGDDLDARVSPLRVSSVDTLSKMLNRGNVNTTAADRLAVTAMLTEEARDLAARSWYRDEIEGFGLQLQALPRMLSPDVQSIFNATSLAAAQPTFFPTPAKRFQARAGVNCAFAVEAMKRNLVRCVSFSSASHDTHSNNYRSQPLIQQELFDTIAALVRALDAAPHPTRMGRRLADHTHIMVVSDFCRTPQINLTLGRDHYPNGSALVISPKFVGNTSFGRADDDQMLPANAGTFADGARAVAPPDLLATFVSAFGVNPRKYLRDGDVIRSLLRA
ncbi:MAG: DUF1501 domain-containing protein [Myxococcaceae bacterium]|nr:MAG: DUF1501 domain-containing protein [Myxococcaceae bacterium]